MTWSTRTPPACRSTARDQVAERRVAALLEPVRLPRRLAPVLSELVERVRRRADRDPRGVRRPHPPRVGAAGVHADGEVVHGAERHPGPAGAWPARRRAARRAPTAATSRSRPRPRATCARRDRAGGRRRAGPRARCGSRCRARPRARSRSRSRERVALRLAVRPERRLPLGAARHRVHDLAAPRASPSRPCRGRSRRRRRARRARRPRAGRPRRGPAAGSAAYSGTSSTRR